jgi:hypothetical protein
MIDINLIPSHLRKKSGKGGIYALNIPLEILFGVGGLFVIVIVCAHALLGADMAKGLIQQQAVKGQWGALQSEKKKLDDLSTEVKDIKKKMNTINDITSKQLKPWAKSINLISDHLPVSLWLRNVYLQSNIFFIEGSAYAPGENEISIVGGFATALKNEDVFKQEFSSVEVNSVTRSKRGKTEVTDFVVASKLK